VKERHENIQSTKETLQKGMNLNKIRAKLENSSFETKFDT